MTVIITTENTINHRMESNIETSTQAMTDNKLCDKSIELLS
jgi:hypothetical protein